jgi:hypothetical protein
MLDGTPLWLQKWIASIAGLITEELAGIEETMQRIIIRDCRLQNLAITVDKIKYCLRNQPEEKKEIPPLRLPTEKEIGEMFWGETNSLRESLTLLYQNNCAINEDQIKQILRRKATSQLGYAKKNLLDLCSCLRTTESTVTGVKGVADVLDMYVNTQHFFEQTMYDKVVSKDIIIRYCDISSGETPKDPEDEGIEYEAMGKMRHRRDKTYSPSYIIGSLVHWFKQTVEKPDASYAADKRGVITLPSFDFDNACFSAQYSPKVRDAWFADLNRAKVSKKGPWKKHSNTRKICGTPMFDRVYDPQPPESDMKITDALTRIHMEGATNVID